MSLAASNPRRIDPIVGQIVEASELAKTNSDYAVVNFKVEAETKNSLGLILRGVKRVCLFFEQAEMAARSLKKGDYVCFDSCSQQDRVYTSAKSGEKVMTSDIIAKEFCTITPEQYEELSGMVLKTSSGPGSTSVETDPLDEIEWAATEK